MQGASERRGVAASVAGSVLFSVMFSYVTLMEPLARTEIFGWRKVLNAPVIMLLVVLTRDWLPEGETVDRVRR